jgi:hypothetical protein
MLAFDCVPAESLFRKRDAVETMSGASRLGIVSCITGRSTQQRISCDASALPMGPLGWDAVIVGVMRSHTRLKKLQ